MHNLISMFSCNVLEVMNLIRRDSVTGTPIVPKNLICSRLRTEFEEIEFLGKGGFGDVVKVCDRHYSQSCVCQAWGQIHEFETTCTLLKYFLISAGVLILILKYYIRMY